MRFVYLAGIGNSEPEHWQSIWHRSSESSIWVEHDDWNDVHSDKWVEDLARTLAEVPGEKLLIAHSLGCLLACEWRRSRPNEGVIGSFLVSVPDVTGPRFPKQAVGFAPALEGSPPLPGLIVASTNDEYGTIDHAQRVARAWKVDLANVGARGHINLASNLGDWPEGRTLLQTFVASLPPRR
jgi:predicted alpha/beta hydrolase family esterase